MDPGTSSALATTGRRRERGRRPHLPAGGRRDREFFGGLAILIAWLDGWGSLATWFSDQSIATLTIGLPAAVALVAAPVSYPGIRRVVPSLDPYRGPADPAGPRCVSAQVRGRTPRQDVSGVALLAGMVKPRAAGVRGPIPGFVTGT